MMGRVAVKTLKSWERIWLFWFYGSPALSPVVLKITEQRVAVKLDPLLSLNALGVFLIAVHRIRIIYKVMFCGMYINTLKFCYLYCYLCPPQVFHFEGFVFVSVCVLRCDTFPYTWAMEHSLDTTPVGEMCTEEMARFLGCRRCNNAVNIKEKLCSDHKCYLNMWKRKLGETIEDKTTTETGCEWEVEELIKMEESQAVHYCESK